MLEKKLLVIPLRYTLTLFTSLVLLLTTFHPKDEVSAQRRENSLQSLEEPYQAGSFELLPTTLIRKIDSSNQAWTPSSPDPSGAAYWPSRGTLLIADAEVDEMSDFFTGDNVFESSLTGSLVSTCSTTDANRRGWSNEPTGVAINPDNDHIFFSDDGLGGNLYEVDPGRDRTYCTADDRITTTEAPGNGDPEGIAYGENQLFIAGGHDQKVYRFDLGPNGVLGGGDDGQVTSFDTGGLGFLDLEGIEYNPDAGTLFIVSTASNDHYIGEVSLTGEPIHLYDLGYLGKLARSGLAYGPSSWNPATKSIYLVSSGIDNLEKPDENDGAIWEIHLGEVPVDEAAPHVLDITLADPSPTSVDSVQFNVLFSEAVTGVDKGDFILSTTGGITNASISAVSGSGSTYTVKVDTGTGNGTLRLDLVDRESIQSREGKPLGGAGFDNGNFTGGAFYEVHKGALLLEPRSLNFENTVIRDWSPTQNVTIRNTGTGPVQLGKISIGDSEASDQVMFLMGNSCEHALLEAGESCTVSAAFHPVTKGAVSGQVIIPSDALGGPHRVDLLGIGACRFPFLSDFSFLAWLADRVCPSSSTEV